MTIKVRPYRRGGWEVDINTRTPEGKQIRERVKAPVTSKSAAERWARARENVLALGLDRKVIPVPTVAAFTERYFLKWATANRNKPSGIATRKRAMTLHVLPILGSVKLNEITEELLAEIKTAMHGNQPRTVNGALSALGAILRVAVRWHVIPALPCPVDLLRVPRVERPFYERADFSRLVVAAARIDWKAHLIVLLGGRAGLRRGELLGLRWVDINRDRETITVRRQITNGRVSGPKGGHERTIPISGGLLVALDRYRHIRGDYVICWDNGRHLCESAAKRLADSAAKSAGLPAGIHILRHTFVSHLVMDGVPPRTIQELAGHRSLATTMGYMHLSPAAVRDGIAMLDRGDMLETGKTQDTKGKGGKR